MIKFINRTGEIGINNDGLRMWIKEYRSSEDVDIEFENGFISTNKRYADFKRGKIKNPYYLIGEIGINYQGLKMWIKEYRGALDLDIEFENGFITKNKQYEHFKKGQIKNLYYPCVCGIGYIGEGKYQSKIDDKYTMQYITWESILVRCYSQKSLIKRPTYKDCVIYEDWECLQSFGKWFDENYYKVDNEKMHIDKDILIKGNKLYSPETCVFVPQRINSLFIKCDKTRGEYPIGVSYNKRNCKFMTTLRKNGISKNLGYYGTPEEAFEVYKIEKEKYIKEIAEEYKGKIPQKLYDALYKYEVEITD